MDTQNSGTENQKKADTILFKFEEVTSQLYHVKRELKEFTDTFYPPELEKEVGSEKPEPYSFEERVKEYLERQKDVANDLQMIVEHLRTFI